MRSFGIPRNIYNDLKRRVWLNIKPLFNKKMTQLVSLGSITFAEFSDDFSNVFNIKINIGGKGI